MHHQVPRPAGLRTTAASCGDPESEGEVWWGPGSPNFEMDEKGFLINRERAIDYLNTQERLYVVDGYVNWDPRYRFKVRCCCCC